jgi:hypothetical protein
MHAKSQIEAVGHDPNPQGLVMLDIERIRRDGGTQARVACPQSISGRYAELMKAGVQFPPVRVWFDGENYWLADGFQRTAAAEIVGRTCIASEVHHGTLEDARWDSFQANSSHGLPRTRADIEAVVRNAIEHPKALPLSNNQFARYLGIPESTLRRLRKRLFPPGDAAGLRVAVRAGKAYSIDTSSIGKRPTGSGRVRPKSRACLRRELSEMKASASPEARGILNVIGNWVFGNPLPPVCLDATSGGGSRGGRRFAEDPAPSQR